MTKTEVINKLKEILQTRADATLACLPDDPNTQNTALLSEVIKYYPPRDQSFSIKSRIFIKDVIEHLKK